MSKFTARVELHGASEGDYESLHLAMKDHGFSRFIKSSGGEKYHMPTAEYNLESNSTLSQVLDATKEAVNATGHTGAILVTESAGRKWYGLQQSK